MIAAVATALLVFGRISALMATLPVMNARGVPRRVTLVYSLAISLVAATSVPVIAEPTSLSVLLFGMAGEVATGMVLGLSVQGIFAAFALAAELASGQMNLAMSMTPDPFLKNNETGIGALASWLAAVVFVSTGLHLKAIEIVATSFHDIPPGTLGMPVGAVPAFVEVMSRGFMLGIQLAGPILAMAWLVNLFMALLSKIAPRMNAFFSMGGALTAPAGIFMFSASIPWMLYVHREELEAAVGRLNLLLEAMR